MAAENAPAAAESAAPAAGPSKTPLILALVNTLAVLGALGMLFYTKMVFKRPVITESSERERLNDLQKKPRVNATPGQVVFEPITVNIQSSSTQATTEDGSDAPTRTKLHYVTVGFTLEITDISMKDSIEAGRPRVMDRLLSMLGRKSYGELTTVQGRYLLRSQIAEIVNQVVSGEESKGASPLVTNVFFTQFVVQ